MAETKMSQFLHEDAKAIAIPDVFSENSGDKKMLVTCIFSFSQNGFLTVKYAFHHSRKLLSNSFSANAHILRSLKSCHVVEN